VRDATHSAAVGTADVALGFIAGHDSDGEWFDFKQDFLDAHGEIAGVLTLNIKYMPLKVARGQPPRLVDELVSADYDEDKTRLADMLIKVRIANRQSSNR
jgi:hypothetical protein